MSTYEKRVYLVPAVIRAIELSTLSLQGYLRQIGGNQKYSLGLRLFELGTQAVSSIDIRTEAVPILRKLVAEINETCHLGIIDGNEGMYLLKMEGTRSIRVNSWEGKRLYLHSTAIGKALLAWKSEKELDRIIRKIQFIRLTANTMTNSVDLKRYLRLVKEQGWALDDEENEPYVRCVAAPVRNFDGKVAAAISISGLSTRFDGEYLEHLSRTVKKTAAGLSKNIGSTSQDTST
jgi:DNA-binding IclR family transcriptional regulator